MKPESYIHRNWRLICTSLALLLVLTVNHRAVPAYALSACAAEKTAIHGRDADGAVFKQKVSLEAVSSYTDFNLAEPAAFLTVTFAAPVQHRVQATAGIPYWTFFLQRLATLPISPNAP